MEHFQKDLIIIGGGLGGCAAALSACENGLNVLLTEETDWIGGQLTSQGVPPDEHPWIEKFGATKRYQTLRKNIRAFYERTMDLTTDEQPLNPGNAIVSQICHDPRIALHVLQEM